MRINEILSEARGRKPRFSPEQTAELAKKVLDLFLKGLSLSAISAKLGIKGTNTAMNLLKSIAKDEQELASWKDTNRRNSKIYGLSAAITSDQIEQMKQQYLDGKSVRSIAKQFGVTDGHVITFLKNLAKSLGNQELFNTWKEENRKKHAAPASGIPLNFTVSQKKKMLELYLKGTQPATIGRMFNIRSSSNVKPIIKSLAKSEEEWNKWEQIHRKINPPKQQGKRKHFSLVDIQKMKQLYLAGNSYLNIGVKYDVEPQTIFYHLKQLAKKEGGVNGWEKLRAERAANLAKKKIKKDYSHLVY